MVVQCCLPVPNDLALEILLKLDVKSLFRCKCVCKNWYKMINSCYFTDNHFDRNVSNLLMYRQPPITNPTDELASNHHTWFSLFKSEIQGGHDYLNYPKTMTGVGRFIIGPVKGLFLFRRLTAKFWYRGFNACLLNPVSKEFKPIAVPYSYNLHTYQDYLNMHRFHMLGFGFDPLNRDFKVVSVACSCQEESYIGIPRVVVYSLRHDSWKVLNLDKEHDPLHKKSRLFQHQAGTQAINGTCYWMLRDALLLDVENLKYFLLSFNLTNYVLREIKVPECQYCFFDPTLVVYNDSIAVFFHYPLNGLDYFELMVMKTEGRWTKQLTVNLGHLGSELYPLGFWNNNPMFLHLCGYTYSDYGDMKIVLYDQIRNEVKEHGINGHPFVYKESLVSLKGGKRRHQVFTFDQDIFRTRSLGREDYGEWLNC